jgi:Sugar diacid utilization regulator
MLISVAMILDQLSKTGAIASINKKNSNRVKTVKLLMNADKPLKDDILYLLPYEDLELQASQSPCLNAFVLLDSAAPHSSVKIPPGWIMITGAQPLEQTLEAIRDAFLYYDYYFEQVLLSINRQKGLKPIVDLIALCLSAPVLIYDNDMKLLSYSEAFPITGDAAWDNTVSKGFVDMYGESSKPIKKYLEQSKSTSAPLLLTHKDLHYPVIALNITLENKRVGAIHVVEFAHPFTEGMMDAIEIFAPYISIEMSRNAFYRSNMGLLNCHLFFDLLENNIPTREVFEHRTKCLLWKQPSEFYILSIESTQDFLSNAQLSELNSQIKKILPVNEGVIHNQGLVLMLDKARNTHLLSQVPKPLMDLLQKKNLFAGLSLASGSPIETHILYAQAKKAIQYGMKTNPDQLFYRFDDHILDMFFEESVQNNIGPYYIHPSIRILAEYDLRHKTAFTETLRVFFFNQCNQLKTACDLNIHRSTLLYRIGKIKEIMSINLEDADTIFHLDISLRLLKHI